MNLLAIKEYLMQVKIASLAKISAHFNCEVDLLRNMMTHWLRKGCVRKAMQTSACGKTCMKCMPQVVEIYEWVEPHSC